MIDYKPRRRRVAATAVVGLAAVAAGCTTNIPPMEEEFPTPLIETLPLRMGVYYDANLRDFTYNETLSDGSRWTIELGATNIRLFNRLLNTMFAEVYEVESLDGPYPAAMDGVLRPVLEEYAFLTPAELGSRFYAVSIRYRLFLHDVEGNEVTNWVVNAYGQSRSGFGSSGRLSRQPLQNATNVAMRDAAAATIILLREQSDLVSLLGEEAGSEEEDADEPVALITE